MLASKFRNLVCAEIPKCHVASLHLLREMTNPKIREAWEAFQMLGRLLKHLKRNEKARMKNQFI